MIPNFENEALSIEVRPIQGENLIQVFWRGKSNSRHPAKVLDPYLSDLAAKAAGANLPVEMHFETLEYFNSSTVSSLIRFIRLAKDNKLRMRMIYSEGTSWQKLSFESLGVFADDQLVFEGRRGAA